MNSLNKVINKNQVVNVNMPDGSLKPFICEKGPGMVPSARSSLIYGKWLNGSTDHIKGDWIAKPEGDNNEAR